MKKFLNICFCLVIILGFLFLSPYLYNFINGYITSDININKQSENILTGSEYSFDETYNIYYSFLTDDEKDVYKQIYANVLELNTSITPINSITIYEADIIIESFYNDHPEIFWLNTSYTYTYDTNNECVEIVLSYNETAKDLETYQYIFEKKANAIIEVANTLSSDFLKEKYVHDTLINLIEYDEDAIMNQSAYSALVSNKTVCSGYARAFQYIMNSLGIPTYYVSGTGDVEHAWNIVKLDDGYYNVDLTWDDEGKITYNYFNLTDSEFGLTHTRSSLSQLLPKCNGTKYRYTESTQTKTESQSNIVIEENYNIIVEEEIVIEENIIIDPDSEEDTTGEEVEDSTQDLDNDLDNVNQDTEENMLNKK